MIDLYQELKSLIIQLNRSETPYALCGGLSLAVHGIPRATLDIDLLILEESYPRLRQIASNLGYQIEVGWLNLAGGDVKMFRVTKIDTEDDECLPLDLILVTPSMEMAWSTREKVRWEGEDLWVVSREGLTAMKSLRGSGQDHDDLKKLKALHDDT
ncbi:MAG: hypothetical protein HY892_03380 [Deltaproteobacteria bacterium]|nr:hypothetical protein [Deltaproteobacteria bacterium]